MHSLDMKSDYFGKFWPHLSLKTVKSLTFFLGLPPTTKNLRAKEQLKLPLYH